VIICRDPDFFEDQLHFRMVLAHSRKSLKEAFKDFIKTPDLAGLVLYNKENAEKLFSDFISLFWYLEAAGGVVRNNSNERLFIFRFGKWDLPKGKIEKGETPYQAALREVSEETGLSGQSVICELPSTWHIYEHKSKKVIKRTFWYAMYYGGNEKLVPQLEEDITEAIWLPETKTGMVTANTYASLLDLIEEDRQFEK